MREKLKNLGAAAFGFAMVAAGVAVVTLFFKGAEWLGEHVLQGLLNAASMIFLFDVLLLLPLAISRRCRPWSGLGLYLSSLLFGLTTWFIGLLLTSSLWGIGPTIIGLLFMGVGVVPMGMLATFLKGMWPELMWLTIYSVVTIGSRMIGAKFVFGNAANEYEV